MVGLARDSFIILHRSSLCCDHSWFLSLLSSCLPRLPPIWHTQPIYLSSSFPQLNWTLLKFRFRFDIGYGVLEPIWVWMVYNHIFIRIKGQISNSDPGSACQTANRIWTQLMIGSTFLRQATLNGFGQRLVGMLLKPLTSIINRCHESYLISGQACNEVFLRLMRKVRIVFVMNNDRLTMIKLLFPLQVSYCLKNEHLNQAQTLISLCSKKRELWDGRRPYSGAHTYHKLNIIRI